MAVVDVDATPSMREKRDKMPRNGTARHKVTQGARIDDAHVRVRPAAHMENAHDGAKPQGAEAVARMRREAAAHAADGRTTSATASNPVHHDDADASDVIVVDGDVHRSQTSRSAALHARPESRGTASMRTKKVAFNKTPSHVASMMQEAVAALQHANDTAPQRTTPKDPDSDEKNELLRRARCRAGAASLYSSAPSPPSHSRQRAVNRRRIPTRTIYGSSSSSGEVAEGSEESDDGDNHLDDISGNGTE